ncbi:Sec-independent protein translocase subunit TatA [Nonomuraea muscovyensis]|jgi:sec-independent protein translocase protein TatA|uniref:Sec-independent protein translocase protein TatA n=1 Tax=Nonomuraea muscovyensis TaxID=1124761 RepID=A0A7X0C4F0_9ACTN|nr:Sec-independent protein translocase subunit TatA [Nonomuraea muscovyensis]MBB6348328.1 sec-independent protein translocase protein TatA [Nonomuraea muscovyensis]MDF2708678.1 Sec-independent protein translocase TatA [Nonomuraea muscovyensis]
MPNLGVPELLIIALVLILLFGAKKLPEMARGVGRSLRIFKAETAKLRDDDEHDGAQTTAQATVQPQAQPQQPVQPQPIAPVQPVAPAQPSAEEQARQLEEQAARLRANAAAQADKRV